MPQTAPKYVPETMNIELTTKCPLHCPQCYCSLSGGKDIEPDTAIYWIEQGAKMGVKNVELSGGETLCYPYLLSVIQAAKKAGVTPNIALSGYRFDQKMLDNLIQAGVGGIFVSLNGSTEDINSLTRDGYDFAIHALKLLKENNYPDTTINWVMHCNNTEDFPNLLKLAENMCVNSIVIIGLKPDSHDSLHTLPTREQMEFIKKIIRSQKGKPKIYVETCFSMMLALVCDTKLFGNMNLGKHKGCGAGLTTFSVNVDGLLSPCRHLDYFEKFENLQEYWDKSETLNLLRRLALEKPSGSCTDCRLKEYCRPCYAANSKIEGRLYRGNHYCPLSP